ncbi:helix-turn-helix domain-containing protein [Actinacidiphila glaucinigra]|uniref:helix-turn-helix domain-containing protein n=1 Tax=Actinacidiphila glaucinigra TaxID=235986 RepID=UPI003D94AA55
MRDAAEQRWHVVGAGDRLDEGQAAGVPRGPVEGRVEFPPGADGGDERVPEAEGGGDDGPPVPFDDAWPAATLFPQAAVGPAASHPELILAVRRFADNGFSLTATGRALHLHPDTVKHRLNRRRELSGWDVHTWHGLSASLLGPGLAQAGAFGPQERG